MRTHLLILFVGLLLASCGERDKPAKETLVGTPLYSFVRISNSGADSIYLKSKAPRAIPEDEVEATLQELIRRPRPPCTLGSGLARLEPYFQNYDSVNWSLVPGCPTTGGYCFYFWNQRLGVLLHRPVRCTPPVPPPEPGPPPSPRPSPSPVPSPSPTPPPRPSPSPQPVPSPSPSPVPSPSPTPPPGNACNPQGEIEINGFRVTGFDSVTPPDTIVAETVYCLKAGMAAGESSYQIHASSNMPSTQLLYGFYYLPANLVGLTQGQPIACTPQELLETAFIDDSLHTYLLQWGGTRLDRKHVCGRSTPGTTPFGGCCAQEYGGFRKRVCADPGTGTDC